MHRAHNLRTKFRLIRNIFEHGINNITRNLAMLLIMVPTGKTGEHLQSGNFYPGKLKKKKKNTGKVKEI